MKHFNLLTFVLFLLFGYTLKAQETNHTMMYDGLERAYILYLPANYTPNSQMPLVFNLHGLGSNSFQQRFYSGMNAVADTSDFIVVYPDGIENAWNCGFNAPYDSGVDDKGYIAALIDTIDANYGIDRNRVYSCGMSMGGFMSYYLACERSDIFAAVASVTGSITDSVIHYCDLQRPVPIMQFHGTEDPTVPYNGMPGAYPSMQGLVDFWVGQNNCTSTDVTMYDIPDTNLGDSSTADVVIYDNCENNSQVILYTIYGGEHTWPGASLNIGITNKDVNASEEIWKFFSGYTLEGAVIQSANTTTINKEILALYPNPFEEQLTIDIQQNEVEEIQLININGQVVYEANQNEISGNQSLSINTAFLATGIYLLKVSTKEEQTSYKIVKQ